MQAKLERGKTAFRTRSADLSVAILASVPFTLVLCASGPAVAACGASRPAGMHGSEWRRRRREKPGLRKWEQRCGAARPTDCQLGQSRRGRRAFGMLNDAREVLFQRQHAFPRL